MDYIKKEICLDGERTRTQGIMPYYELGKAYEQHPGTTCFSISELGLETADGPNGNWGQFVANPCFLSEHNKTYNTLMYDYYQLLNMVRDGVKLRKVNTKNNEIIFTEDLESFSIDGQCFYFGPEPESLYEYAAYNANDFHATNIESLRDETRTVYRYNGDAENVNDYVVLIQNYDKFIAMSHYLSGVSIPATLSAETITENEHAMWSGYCSVVDACVGNINIPASIYNKHIKVPKKMPCSDVAEYIEWLKDNESLSGDCCNARLWDDMGGEDMLDFLEASAETKCEDYRKAVNELNYSVPYVEMPILLIQNFTDVGVLTNIDGVDYGNEDRPHKTGTTGEGPCIEEIVMASKRAVYPKSMEEYEEDPEYYSGKTIEVESLLKTLAGSKRYTDDDDNILPGLFKKYDGAPGGKYFKCEKNGNEWNISEYTGQDLTNGDGMTSEEIANAGSSVKFYRTVTTESAAKRISEVYDEEPKEYGEAEATVFYYKVKYENSQNVPMLLPYTVGNATNVYFVESGETDEDPFIYRGDFIAEAPAINGDEIEIKYVIGGYYRADAEGNFIEYIGSGDVYYEKHTYDPAYLIYVPLNGVDNVPIYTQYIDFEKDTKEFYSPAYGFYRTGNTANIIEATTGEYWNEDYAYDAYLTKEEYLTNFSLPPKVDVNVTIDRGGASAFESHYKLSECNTMQDLTQYGNNYFNL